MFESINIFRYCFIFTLIYGVLLIAINIITSVFNISAGGGLNIVSFIVAIYFSAYKFAQEQSRAPSKKERLKLATGSLIAAYILSLIVAVVVAFISDINLGEIFNGISIPMLMGSLSIITIVYFTGLYFAYSWFAKLALKQLSNK